MVGGAARRARVVGAHPPVLNLLSMDSEPLTFFFCFRLYAQHPDLQWQMEVKATGVADILEIALDRLMHDPEKESNAEQRANTM